MTVFFGQGPYQGDSFPPPATAAIADCAGIDDFGDTNSPPFRNQIKVAGRIGSNITGNMNVGGVRVFRVDGNIQSAIDVQPSIFWQSGQFTDFRVVGDILASGLIVSRFGDIQSMVVLGSVFGPVSCVQGAIRSLQITGDLAAQVKAGVAGGSAGLIESLSIGGAALRGQQSEPDIFAPVGTTKSVQVAGDIGTPFSLVRIEWRGSPSDGACELISGDSLHLSLNATDQNSEINRVFAGFDITGSLAFGKLRRVNAQSGLVISRDCTANIHIRGDVDAPMTIANLLATNSTITIGGKLLCPGGNCATPAVTLPIASGLRGQLVINAINDGREWFGNVQVGSLTLSQSAPYYTYPQSSTLFGGGAVGRVPFDLHVVDCSPAVARSIGVLTPPAMIPKIKPYSAPCAANPIRLMHYGPIANTRSPNTDKNAVELEYRAVAGDPWSIRMDLLSTASVESAAQRVLVLTPSSFLPPGQYRVSIKTDVKCVLLGTASSVATTGYTAWFNVEDACPGDLNGDGQRNTADLTAFLSHFGESSSNGCGVIGDFNLDGSVNTPDLTFFLGRFGVPCPPGDPESSATPEEVSVAAHTGGAAESTVAASTPPGPVIAALGFASAEAYQSFLDSLTPAELEGHVMVLLQVIQSLGLD